MWYNSSFQTICMSILDISSACLRLAVDSSSFWLWSLWWTMSESFHSQLLSWIKLFLASLDLHEVLRCLLSVFWWSFSDCLCLVWCIHHVLVSRSFYTLCALSLQFSLFMSETFLKLFKLLNSSREVRCLRFQACEATLLDLVALSTCLRFSERSDRSISFVSFSSFFFSLFSLESHLLLLHRLMMMFWMWNAYFPVFIVVYWEVEWMSSTSVHSSQWMHLNFQSFFLKHFKDIESTLKSLLFMNDLCSSFSLTLMSVLVDQWC